MRNALTVDLEDWFQVSNFDELVSRDEWDEMPSRVEESTRRLLELFDEFGVKSTFFVLGWVAERYPHLVREVADAGHEIASHSSRHELVYTLDPERFGEDLDRANEAIDAACGRTPRGYRAPSFSVDHRSLWALDVLRDRGFDYDSSVFPVRHPRYGIPEFARYPHRVRTAGGGELVEFPMTTLRILGRNLGASGGGYLRIFPPAVMDRAFRQAHAAGQPAVLYLHPWEVDPDQPRLRPRGLGRFTHYWNLGGTLGRLRHLLRTFEFGTMEEALAVAPDLREPARPVGSAVS